VKEPGEPRRPLPSTNCSSARSISRFHAASSSPTAGTAPISRASNANRSIPGGAPSPSVEPRRCVFGLADREGAVPERSSSLPARGDTSPNASIVYLVGRVPDAWIGSAGRGESVSGRPTHTRYYADPREPSNAPDAPSSTRQDAQDRSGEASKAITTSRNHGRNRIESRDHDRRDENLLLDPANDLGESRVPLPQSVPLLARSISPSIAGAVQRRAEPAGLEVPKRVNVETKAPCDLVRPHSCFTSPCHEIVKP